MAELIERDLLCHSLNQHLRQGLCKGDEKMNCAMTGLNPYSFMKGFEYGMELAQTIVCNRPTTTEAEIRASAIDEAMEKLAEEICTGCGCLKERKCTYKGSNCRVSKTMLEKTMAVLEQLKEE